MASGEAASGDTLSVIIPSWREGPRLLDAIGAARLALGAVEVVVAAREESAEVRDRARADGVVWVDCPEPNRGQQLALGASHASSPRLVFLHADSRLPVAAGALIHLALDASGVCGGAFRLRFDHRHPALDLLAFMSRVDLPTSFLGDQCMFCVRSAYEAAGGFRAYPLFEDVDLACRLSRVGRLVRVHESVTTSARRFLQRGPYRQLITNAVLMLAFHTGVSPRRLAQVYAPSSADRAASGAA